jgi:phosphate transport system protein
MSHLDSEIRYLKEELMDMHRLVHLLVTEKRVNGLELKIDRDCENILALFNPVAVDLRFVLAALKINSNLERIGDNAESIARYVLDVTVPFPQELVSAYAIEHLADTALSMLEDAMAALEKDDTAAARKIFLKDDLLDVINRKATAITIELIQAKNAMPLHFLNLLSIVRKFERIGDQTKNISEEIIFFIEAKVLRHGQKLD